MRILIDDGLTAGGMKSGIGHHAESLMRALAAFDNVELTDYDNIRKLPRYFQKWTYIAASNVESLVSKYALVHHLSQHVPFLAGKSKHVVTLYDMSIIRFPETVSISWRWYNLHAFKKAVERAEAIIVISKSIRDELILEFPVLSSKPVFVCPVGLRQTMREGKTNTRHVEDLGITPYSYFLYVGDLTRRKNLPALLSVFIEARETGRIEKSTKLILVGKKAWGYADIQPYVREENGVIALGYLDESVLPSLYHFAKALVFPSLYEGFGIPVIEAMSQRVPIIASNIPSNVELNILHNHHMLTFDVADRKTLSLHLEDIDKNHFAFRESLDYGDLAPYTYERIAKRHLEIYGQVCQNG